MYIRALFLVVATWCVGATAHAAMKIADLRDRAAVIEYAAHVGDFRQLTQISDLLVEQTARGNLQKLVHYYSALAAYRAAEIDADVEYRVGVLLDRCVDQGKAALKLDPEFAEALALIGACHGLAAARQPLAAIVSGNFSARELKRALALAPENPRVQLLHAITLMRRYESPQRRAQAEESLGEALRLFDAFATMDDAESPQWGQEHAHLWMARLALANDDKVAARDHLEQALLIAPDFEMARVEFTSLGS